MWNCIRYSACSTSLFTIRISASSSNDLEARKSWQTSGQTEPIRMPASIVRQRENGLLSAFDGTGQSSTQLFSSDTNSAAYLSSPVA